MKYKVGLHRICEECKLGFNLNPRLGLKWIEKTGRGRFCSDKCSRLARKGKRTSPNTEFKKTNTVEDWKNHPRFKNGIWAYRRWLKDNCEECGSTKYLVVHHLDEDRNNNELSNLKTLCQKCHLTVYHKEQRKFYGNQHVKV